MVSMFPCRYCKGKATTWDHAHPRSRGGTNEYWEPPNFEELFPPSQYRLIEDQPKKPPNLFPCCASCNNDKGNMTHEEYLYLLSLRKAGKHKEIERFTVICKIRAISEKIALMKQSIERVRKARQDKSLNNDESMLLREFPHKIDEMANSRLYLCVKALNLGVSLGTIARMLGETKHKNRLRKSLKLRGYKPREK